MYGFDSETRTPHGRGLSFCQHHLPAIPEKTEADIQAVDIIIDSANASRDEKDTVHGGRAGYGDLTIGMCVCIHRRCGVKTSEGLAQPGNGKRMQSMWKTQWFISSMDRTHMP